MEGNVVESAALVGSVGADHLSILGLIMEADLIVKIVIFVLAVASIWSWTIIFEKTMRFRLLRGLAEKF